MTNVKFLEIEDVIVSDISEEFATLKVGGVKFAVDADTMYELTFRLAETLALMEAKSEDAVVEADLDMATCAECSGRFH